MEPLVALAVRVTAADPADIAELVAVAARTFPLACPPSVTPENIASFVQTNLSAARFAEYLADANRVILTARHGGRIVGYAMLVRDHAGPAVELSKIYVLPENHGAGVATALMDAVLSAAADWGTDFVWLGVNQKNLRAQQFYKKCGFTITGTRTFQLGDHIENDFVMSLSIDGRGQRQQP